MMRFIVLFSALSRLISETGAFSFPYNQRSTISFGLFAKKSAANEGDEQPVANKAKKAALDGVLQQIERSYGRGSIVKLGEAKNMIVDCIGSGSLTLGEYRHVLVACFGLNIFSRVLYQMLLSVEAIPRAE
jgi:hypothetical protein